MSIAPDMDGTTEPVTVSGLLARATRGAIALGARQVLVTGLNIIGAAALARLVSPATFGVYAVAAFVVGFLNFFAEAGLGASLIRQQSTPSARDQQSAFTLQFSLSIVVVVIGWLLAPMIARSVDAVPHTVFLIRLALLSLVVSSAQLVPGAMLERELRFSRIGAINVAQAFAFNGFAVGLAAAGWPVIGVGIAMLSQSILGSVLLGATHPWRPGFVLREANLRERLGFSVPLQFSSILSSLKDAIAPLFVGALLGAHSVGLVEWANSFAAYPVLALMAFQSVYLPTFARLQHDVVSLGRAVDTVLRGTNMIVAPLACLTLALATPMTSIVFGDKWLVALPTFRLFWVANVFVASVSPLLSLLYARGQSITALYFTVTWMIATWALGVPLIHAFGIKGYGAANVGVQLTNLWLFHVAKKQVPIHLFTQFWRSWLTAGVIGGLVYLLSRSPAPTSAIVLLGEFLAGLLVYVLVMVRLEARVFKQVFGALRNRA